MAPAREIGPYRILAEIGVGGMGTVYRAETTGAVAGLAAGDVVALKIVHPHLLRGQGFFKRFLREGEIGRRIRHKNVVATLDLDGITVDSETVLYIAMEYVEGQTLWDLHQEIGPASEELCRHLAHEIAEGLEAIHAVGVVHRDLKPENVIVARSPDARPRTSAAGQVPEDYVVKVMDLGVARLDDARTRLSNVGMFIGSTLYASPEQFGPDSDKIDGRADLFALGVMLYELSTGVHPFDADKHELVMKRLVEETPKPPSAINPRLSPFFEEVVLTLIAKTPEERFASARELADVLEQGEHSEWWKARARAIREETKRPLRRVQVPRETPLIGREPEVGVLETLWQQTKAGEGRAVLVEGEAGIGKTRLVDEFLARLDAAGEEANVLVGGFPPGGGASGASAFIQAFAEFFGVDDVHAAAATHLAKTPILAPAFGALLSGEATPEGAEPLTNESLQTVLVHVARSLADERPTIFIIEDLHLAPDQGLALFAALALAIRGHRVLLLGSVRPGVSESWTAGLTRLPHARHLVLKRLGLKDLARLLVAAVGSERLADEIGYQIILKSEGNPFFVFEILRSLREQGALVEEAGGALRLTRPIREIGIPSSIQEIVKARIALLSEEERDVLEVAACCGFEFDPRLVGDAMKVDRVTLLKRLAKIERSHRLVHSLGDLFVFDHHEIRVALVEGLPEGLRREYHAALAERIEERVVAEGLESETATELTEHFLAAGLGRRALKYAAGALSQLDHACSADLAADLARRVLADPNAVSGRERIEMLMSQAERLDLLGRREDERAVLEEARELADASSDARLSALTRVGAARWYRNLAYYSEALDIAGEALELAAIAGDPRAEAASRAVLADIHFEMGKYDKAKEHLEREIAIRQATDDKLGEAAATGRLGAVFRRLGRFEEAYGLFARDMEINDATGSRLGRALVKRNLGSVLFALGRYEDARANFERAHELSRLIGYRRGEAMSRIDLGEVCLVLGAPEEASTHLHAAMRLCVETGIRYVHARALHGLALRSAGGTEPGKAFRRARRAIRLRRAIGDRAGLAASLLLLGRLRKLAGAVKSAASAFEEAGEIARELDLPGERVLSAVHLGVLPGGDPDSGLYELEKSEKRLEIGDRMEARFLLWLATGEPAHLAKAHELLQHVVRHVPEERRAAVVADVPLHRSVHASLGSPSLQRPSDDGGAA